MTISKAGINSQSGNRLDDIEPTVQDLEAAVQALEAALPTLATKLIPTRQITGATENILATDINKELVSNTGSAQSVVVTDTLNTAAVIGDKVSLLQFGAGIPSITVTGAQTTNGSTAAKPLKTRYQGVVITKIANNTWCVTGAI